MKIVVLGGKGFIGTALVAYLKKKKHSVVVMDLKKEDIRKPNTFSGKLKRINADVVVNLAAVLGTIAYSPGIRELFDTNVMGNLTALQASYNAGIRNYVFTSSMTVHGENKPGKHHTRFSPFCPKQAYSASKAAAEFAMMYFAKENPSMRIAVVRPTMVLGEGTYLPHAPIEFIKAVLVGKNIELYGSGEHEREWIWIDDCVKGIEKALTYTKRVAPGYYPFFLSGARISMCDLARLVVKKTGGKITRTSATRQAFTLTADSSESQKMLKWKPRNNMDMMIDKLIMIHKK